MPKVSIIVPVYNAAGTIIRCIDSLFNQTLDDMEFILVDDHGYDDSIGIAKRHIAGHSREKQVLFAETPVNSGPGEARNIGMQIAKGEYVAFCDADDWVEPDMYEKLFGLALLKQADFVYCNALIHVQGQTAVLANPDFRSNAYYLTHFVAYLWTYLFRSYFIRANEITFPESRRSEDTCFLACCIMSTDRIASIDEVLYHYVVYSSSTSHRAGTNNFHQRKRSFAYLHQFSDKHQLSTRFCCQLWWIRLKKLYLTSFKEWYEEIVRK